jgi:hypothetical protein
MIRVDQAMANDGDTPSSPSNSRLAAVGTAIGLVQIFAIATVQPLGVSTAYPQFCGVCGGKTGAGLCASQPYLQKIGNRHRLGGHAGDGYSIGALLSRPAGGEVKRECNCLRAAQLLEQFAVPGSLQRFVGGFLIIFGHGLPMDARAGTCSAGWHSWLSAGSCLEQPPSPQARSQRTPADEAQQPCPRR